MKRTFLAKRNALLSSASASVGLYAVLFAFLVLVTRIVAPNVFLHVATPVFHAADFLAEKANTIAYSFLDSARLARERNELQERNRELANENRALTEKLAILGSFDETLSDARLAEVVARPPESPYDTLVLGSGAGAGLSVGMAVFAPGSVPIGTITSVSEDFARVTLFSAPGRKSHATVGTERIPLELFGTGGGTLEARVARTAGVIEGDTVFAPGPHVIGAVVRVDSDPSEPEAVLRIQLSVNLFSLDWVALVPSLNL